MVGVQFGRFDVTNGPGTLTDAWFVEGACSRLARLSRTFALKYTRPARLPVSSAQASYQASVSASGSRSFVSSRAVRARSGSQDAGSDRSHVGKSWGSELIEAQSTRLQADRLQSRRARSRIPTPARARAREIVCDVCSGVDTAARIYDSLPAHPLPAIQKARCLLDQHRRSRDVRHRPDAREYEAARESRLLGAGGLSSRCSCRSAADEQIAPGSSPSWTTSVESKAARAEPIGPDVTRVRGRLPATTRDWEARGRERAREGTRRKRPRPCSVTLRVRDHADPRRQRSAWVADREQLAGARRFGTAAGRGWPAGRCSRRRRR